MAHHTESRIILLPHSRPVRILAGDILIADSCNAIELLECGYPPRPDFQKELPRADVDMSKLSVSSTVNHCPLKGDIAYYSLFGIADVV